MRRRLVISPHLDDAVISAWRGLTSAPSTVVTLFAGLPAEQQGLTEWDRLCGAPSSRRLMQKRRDEDLSALACCGARAIHLDLLDHQYRLGPSPRQAVVDALEALVADFDEIWIPAGMGGHPDHELAARAALVASSGMERVMYADLPYAARDWGETVRLSPDGAGEEAWRAAVRATCRLAPRESPSLGHLSAEEAHRKRQAVSHYDSQIGGLAGAFPQWWDDEDLFAREWTWRLPPSDPEGSPLAELVPLGASESPPVQKESRPFLSVIVRTEGRRAYSLSQALESLSAQRSRDLELLVVAHNVGGPEREALEKQLAALPGWLSARSALLDAVGGTRARPLNMGLAAASGHYVAALDDDDYALPEWVEEFTRLAGRRPGRVLRTRVARTYEGEERTAELFAPHFELLDHLTGNQTPLCGVAFPLDEMMRLNLWFDESLEVVEDWDLLVRSAQLLGVVGSSAITSHYRHWPHAEDSRRRHSTTTWEVAMRRVVDKADARPLLLPTGSVAALGESRARLEKLEGELPGLRGRLEESERTVAETEGTLAELQSRHADLEAHQLALRAELGRLHAGQEAERAAHLGQLELLEQEAQARLERVTEAFTSSRSWRLTAPLRTLGRTARRVARPGRSVSEELSPAGSVCASAIEPGTVREGVPPSHFDALYAQHQDPWGMAREWYEKRKYALTVAALPRARYRRGFEPGCSIGVLTEALAARCDTLVAADCAAASVAQADSRLRGRAEVSVVKMTVPAEWPEGLFDLVVVSELARYLADDDLFGLIDRTIHSLEPGGHLVLVHHCPEGPVPQSAERVHAAFAGQTELFPLAGYRQPEFLLDVLVRPG